MIDRSERIFTQYHRTIFLPFAPMDANSGLAHARSQAGRREPVYCHVNQSGYFRSKAGTVRLS